MKLELTQEPICGNWHGTFEVNGRSCAIVLDHERALAIELGVTDVIAQGFDPANLRRVAERAREIQSMAQPTTERERAKRAWLFR